MADNFRLDTPDGPKTFSAEEIGGILVEVLKLGFGAHGAVQVVDAAHRLPVETKAEIAATDSHGDNADVHDVSAVIIPSRGGRKMLLIQNPTATDIWLGFDHPAVLNKGTFIAASSGLTLEGWEGDVEAKHGSAGATKTVVYTEFF